MARTADSQPSTGTGVPALVPHGRFKGKPAMPLGRPVTIIGARNRSHLHLVSPAVSKSHAMIVNSGAGVYIRDLASRTHVHVNGQRIREGDLREGDILGVGPFTFRFTDPAGGAPRRDAGGGPAPAVLRLRGRNLPLPINGRVLLIGRRPTCDLVLEDLDVSTTHAVVFQMSGAWFVRDLGSRTGTHINGTAVHQQPLEFGDAIRIGEQEMTLVAASDVSAPALDELEDLAGTAPLAAEEPLDLIFDDEPAAPAPPVARQPAALPPPASPKRAPDKRAQPVGPSRPAARQFEQPLAAPAARVTAPAVAPAGNGRAMPPVVPPEAPVAPAAGAAGDEALELELAPPTQPPSLAAVVAPAPPVAPIPLDDALEESVSEAPVVEETRVAAADEPSAAPTAEVPLDEPAIAEPDVAPVAPAELEAEPAEAARDEVDLAEPAAASVGAASDLGLDFTTDEPGAAAAEVEAAELFDEQAQSEPEPAGAAAPAPESVAPVVPSLDDRPAAPPLAPVEADLEQADLSEFAPLDMPTTSASGAEIADAPAAEPAGKGKKRGGWRRLFGAKKDAESATPQPAAEAPRPVADELPLVDLDELEPTAGVSGGLAATDRDAEIAEGADAAGGGAAAEPAEPVELDDLLVEEPAASAAPLAPASEVEPVDLREDSIAAAISTEPDLEPIAPDFADEVPTREPSRPDSAAGVVHEPELELETGPIELAAEDPAGLGAEPDAPHAVADAPEFEPAPLDAAEVLDKTEPTPESALGLDAALPAADAEASLNADDEDDAERTAAAAVVEEDTLTDSVFGREVEAFEGEGLGPIVEARTPADEPAVEEANAQESLPDELDLVAEPEPTLEIKGETTPVADGREEAPALEGTPDVLDAEDEEPQPSSAATAPGEAEAGRDEPLDLAALEPDDRDEPERAAASVAAEPVAAEPDYGLDFLDAPAADEAVEHAPAALEDAEPEQWVDVAPEAIEESEPADVAAAVPPAVLDVRADDQLVAKSFPLEEAATEEIVVEAVAVNEPAVDASPVELSEAPVVPVAEAGEISTGAELVEAAPDGVSLPAGETESTPVVGADQDGAEPAMEVLGTQPVDAEWAPEPGAVVDVHSKLVDEPLDLAPVDEEAAQPEADEPVVITGEILDAELEAAVPEDPLVFEAGEAGAPGAAGTVDVTDLEPDPLGTGSVPAAGAVEASEPVDLGEPEFIGDALSGSEAAGARVATSSSPAGSAPPAPVDMFFGLERDTASFLGGMPLQLPPLRGPFAEKTRVDFRGSAAEAAGGHPNEPPAETRAASDDEAADEPELLLDLGDDNADGGIVDAPAASSAGPVAAALAPAEPGQPRRPLSTPTTSRGRADVNPFGPIDTPGGDDGGGGGAGAPAGGRMFAGPFDMNLEDAPTDEIEIPPFDGPRPAAGGGGPSAGQVRTAFDGLAMPPVRQADVFSQTPLSSVAIPPFAGAGGAAANAPPASAAPSAERVRQPNHDDFGDDDDEPLDLGFADEEEIPSARARGDNGSNPDLELGEWEEAAAPARPGADRGGTASRRPPAYPAADPAGGRPAPAKKKRWRIGKWGLFGLMLVCMAGATAAIAVGLPKVLPNTARVTAAVKFDDRFASLPQSSRKAMLDAQRGKLESPEVRASAREIAQKKYDLAPGFLLESGGEPRLVQEAARDYSTLVDSAKLADKRPFIELELPTADAAGDRLRVMALLEALYAANKPLLDEAGRIAKELKTAEKELDRAIARREALQPALSAAQKELGESDVVSARRADVEMLRQKEQELSAKWDKATARVRALLADVRASETATAPPDPDADPERLPPLPQEDEEVVEMDRQLKDLTATLAEKKRQRTAQADAASKALQASLQEFEEDIKRARGSMQPDSELGRYLAAADKVQTQLREMSLDLQQQQQSDMQRLTELKRKLADKNEARIRAAFAGDSKLQQLSEALAVADRQFHAAKGGGLREDAAELEKEVAALKQQIADRQDLLTTADGISPEVTELPAIIDDMLARMDADRARNDRRMAEMLKSLASQAPAAGSLPAEQKAFAQKLEARQSELNKARQRYAAAMEAAGAAADAEVRDAESQLAALQAKIDERKKQVAEATRATLSEEQQTARAAATESRKQELARAEEDDKAAEAAFYENRRLLGDAQHALSLVQKDSEEFDRLNRQAVTQDGEITAWNTRLDGLRQTRDASVSPVAPIEDHVAVIGAGPDRRWEYALATNFALGAVFFVLVLMAPGGSQAGDGFPDAGDAGGDLPFASATPGGASHGRNGDGDRRGRPDTPEREDEPLVV